MQYCRRGCFPARPRILVRRWLLICRPRRRREARPAADPGLRNALTVSSSSASPCVAGVTRTERPRMRDVSSTAEEPMVCTTLRSRARGRRIRTLGPSWTGIDLCRGYPGRRGEKAGHTPEGRASRHRTAKPSPGSTSRAAGRAKPCAQFEFQHLPGRVAR